MYYIFLILGSGAIGGLIWGAVEYGNKNTYKHTNRGQEAKSAGIYIVIGIIAGVLCVIGFEIVAFF